MRIIWPLIGVSLALGSSVAAAQPDDARVWLGRKDFRVEAAARSLVVATIAAGQADLGQCFHDQYFGSPLLQRKVLSQTWLKPALNGPRSVLMTLRGVCRVNPESVGSDGNLWKRTGTETLVLELTGSEDDSLLAAGMMMEAYAREKGDEALAGCIGEALGNGLLRKVIDPKQGQPVSVTVHDALRDLCGLNAGNPPASSLSLPGMPDVMTVARERALTTQDLAACEIKDGVRLQWCHAERFRARSKVLRGGILLQSAGP